jgi:hypothetical protein
VLSADVAGARRLLTVLGEIARITGMSLFRHKVLRVEYCDGLARPPFNESGAVRLSSQIQ